MTKKELEKLILEYKPKYLYQRYNGNLTKYEVLSNERIIEVETGIALNLETDYLLGKISNNIIDLIEEGDYVNGYYCRKINNFCGKMCNFDLNIMEWTPLEDIDIFENLVTKEQFEERKFYV